MVLIPHVDTSLLRALGSPGYWAVRFLLSYYRLSWHGTSGFCVSFERLLTFTFNTNTTSGARNKTRTRNHSITMYISAVPTWVPMVMVVWDNPFISSLGCQIHKALRTNSEEKGTILREITGNLWSMLIKIPLLIKLLIITQGKYESKYFSLSRTIEQDLSSHTNVSYSHPDGTSSYF